MEIGVAIAVDVGVAIVKMAKRSGVRIGKSVVTVAKDRKNDREGKECKTTRSLAQCDTRTEELKTTDLETCCT